jgi:predicted Zn-ribbon and HTH transcriptional regulator
MLEVQDIFRQHFDGYRETHPLTVEQAKAARAILACRTAALGAHADVCDECGYEHISYNSCRNRHCPKCQTLAKEDWIDRQKRDLLNCKYFQVVFTVPADLQPLFFQHQRLMYGLLFKAASETLLELCGDKKYLGAKPGITAVLHTWGQTLSYHPHLHCIVTGGGLTGHGAWEGGKKDFFIPVKVLSMKFRGKLLYFLRRQKLQFYGHLDYLNGAKDYGALLRSLYRTGWVVYCKPPFGSAQMVVDYLGRYTHRIAISNNRLIGLDDGSVSFRWRDYADGNKQKVMTLRAGEFIRRFLAHVLPLGFRKIRHYGLFASRGKGVRLMVCKWLTGTPVAPARESMVGRLERIFGADFNLCPRCRIGRLSRASPEVQN